MKYRDYRKKGFTIIEMLVAVSILLVAVAAVFTAAHSGLSSSIGLRNRITATYLAEEAVNGVKNIKDTNLLNILAGSGTNWLEGLEGCTAASPCGYDILENSGVGGLGECSLLKDCRVKTGAYNGDSALVYRQSSDSEDNSTTVDTGFVRTIWVEETLSDKEARVNVEISRPEQSSFNPYRIETFIYNYWPTL